MGYFVGGRDFGPPAGANAVLLAKQVLWVFFALLLESIVKVVTMLPPRRFPHFAAVSHKRFKLLFIRRHGRSFEQRCHVCNKFGRKAVLCHSSHVVVVNGFADDIVITH